jgi:hypothetical protein
MEIKFTEFKSSPKSTKGREQSQEQSQEQIKKELKFDYNIYDLPSQEEINQPVDNYWETHNNPTPISKKKVSFDDILNNMNLVVNKQGILQLITPKQVEPLNEHSLNSINNNNYNSNNKPNLTTPIEPQVKHSYIYNKYFKDYKNDSNYEEPIIRRPKTIEEYKKMVLQDKIDRIKEAKRISQIKPTNLLFSNGSNMAPNLANIRASKNSLRKLNLF